LPYRIPRDGNEADRNFRWMIPRNDKREAAIHHAGAIPDTEKKQDNLKGGSCRHERHNGARDDEEQLASTCERVTRSQRLAITRSACTPNHTASKTTGYGVTVIFCQ
jgi:hypothetical protein